MSKWQGNGSGDDAEGEVCFFPVHKIYIHCNEGVNRSPTITWLYLIHKGLSPEEATEKVKPNRVLYDADIVQQLIANRA